ncbi:MAG: DUF3108 domain-containing protein [Rhizomicrobium sp.]
MSNPPNTIRRYSRVAGLVLSFTSLLAAPALAAGGASTSQGIAQGPATSLEMAMSLYAGGISLGKVDMDAKFTGTPAAGKYHVVSNLQTSGVVNVFWQSEIQATASGKIEGHQLLPELYDSFYTGHNEKHQEVALTYENGYPARLYANPPYPIKGYEVKPDEKKGTFDPLSAMIYIVSGAGAAGNPCAVTAPVFDGRRRYTVSLSKVRDIEIKLDNGLYKGPGVQCEIIYKQISGYSPRVLKDANFPHVYAWFASFNAGGRSFNVPMRVWAKSPYGIVAAVTTSLKINGASPK